MAVGAGRYDGLCTYVREQSKAQAAIVIVMGGNQGDGFSMQAPALAVLALPALLRNMADAIEADVAKAGIGR